MRKKTNLIPRLEGCREVLIDSPEAYRGRWAETFVGYEAMHLELGCGKGRFTSDMAWLNPGIFFLAVERVPEAMVVAMERACSAELNNVRFLDRDAATLSDILAPCEIERIYINFPDPWRKTRQFKRRLTAPPFLRTYSQILKPGGEIWFKTDNIPLFEWSLEQFESEGWEISELSRDLHENGQTGVMTDYEAKFHAEGVKINRLVARFTEGTEK